MTLNYKLYTVIVGTISVTSSPFHSLDLKQYRAIHAREGGLLELSRSAVIWGESLHCSGRSRLSDCNSIIDIVVVAP